MADFQPATPPGQRYQPHSHDVICELPSVPASLYPDFTKWNPSPGSHPVYTLNGFLPQRGRRKLKHCFSTLLFVRVRTLPNKLPCKSRAAVLAESNTRGVLSCLVLGPESHSEKALDLLAVLARTHTTKCFHRQEWLFSLKHGFSSEFFLRVRWQTFSRHAPPGQLY